MITCKKNVDFLFHFLTLIEEVSKLLPVTLFNFITKLVLSFFGCLFFITAAAQEIPHFTEQLTTENGLSSNNINDIIQDDNGFLWVATVDGLNRFDGTEVVQYFHNNNKNSLPNNFIYCLKKLRNNYIAIGTQAGLSFCDCNTGMFKNFYYKHDAVMDEFNNTIVELETDTKGNLWAVSRNCIFIFDSNRVFKKIIASPFTEADVYKDRLKFADKILPLSNGDELLYLLNKWSIYSNKTSKLTDLKNSDWLPQLQFLNDVAYPNLNKYFTATHVFTLFNKYFAFIPTSKDSLFLFDERGNKISSCFFPYNKYPYVWWSQTISVIDSSKILLLFNGAGFVIIPIKWKNNIPQLQNLSPVLFTDVQYKNVLRDVQGNWWLGTAESGLQKISPLKQYFKGEKLIDKNSGEQIQSETVSLNEFNNTLWIASYGNGFFEKDLLSGKQQQHLFNNTGDNIWPNYIWNFRFINSDSVWIGTQAGIFWYKISAQKYGRLPTYKNKPAVIDSVPITTQFTDSYGLVWIGLGTGKGVCCFDNKAKNFVYYEGSSEHGFPLRYPTSIAEDAHSNLWFVNDGSATLVYWVRAQNKFKTVALPAAMQKQISTLNGIFYESDSVLWLGSVTSGLIKFNPISGLVSVYGHQNGLNNTHITSIFEDDKKRLWLATGGGLSCFDRQTENFMNYTTKNGLPVPYPTDYFYYDTSARLLYAGGNGAFFYFNPDAVNFNQPPQKIFITAMRVNGNSLMLSKDEVLKFKPQQNDITIQYTAVDLTNGADTKYAYKLIGEDTGWIFAGSQRQINFSHLAAGNYTFMVRAANSSNVWSNQTANIHFTIDPPFTQTVWFYTLILLGIGGIFYALYRFRLNQLMRTELVRSEISKNLHDEVGSNLTNISLSSLLAQSQLQNKDALSRLLQRMYEDSQTVSETMRDIVWSINPRIDTMGDALPRMLHYASELLEANNIELHAEVAPETEHLKLKMKERYDVYLIFKEAINNIAKHSKANHTQIKLSLQNNKLMMIIFDNGKGFNIDAPQLNNGLKNMQERAESHKWKLKIQSQLNNGTTVTLHT